MSATATHTIGHLIGGARVAGTGARTAPVFDPALGSVQAEVRLADVADVGAAVAAARTALPGWAEKSVGARAKVLFAFRDLLARHADEVARLISSEHGKVLDDARGEIARGLEVVEFACGIPQLLKGDYNDQVSTGVDAISFRQPVGVCAGITPFNFPAMVPLWMYPVAIACGNTFVLKPSERDPSAALRVAELFGEAGLPDGVLNVLQGDKVAVDGLLEHPGVDAVSFVGSTPIARSVHAQATASGKRVQALGGAKNHAVVLPDADLEYAAEQLVSAGYGSAGQRCMAISVAVAVGEVADALVARVAEKTRAIRVGPGLQVGSEMGPLVSAAARERVRAAVDGGVAAGATAVVDGRELDRPEGDGFWVGPTLLDHVRTDMDAYREEIFGPVLAVIRVASLAEAITLINEQSFANGTAIFTASGAAARRFQREVQVGMIGVNVPIPVPMAYHSFGGWKDSLFGDHHVHGPEGVRFYTRAKAVTVRWPGEDDAGAAGHLLFPTTD